MNEPLWVAPRLVCGLGNRLFQTAAAIAVAERLGTEPVFLLPRMSGTEHGNFDLLLLLCPTLRLIESAPAWTEVEENSPIPKTSQGLVLKGFYQRSADFPSLQNPNLPRLPGPIPSSPTWAIHFRLGDYCILPHHQVDLRAYYYQIIKLLPSNTRFLLFSDSPERLPEIQKEIQEMGYATDIFTDKNTLATLTAFASCQGGSICSNSTFSWWAAFFAYQERPDYKAFFPSVWMAGAPAKDIFNFPFTQAVDVSAIPANSCLKSFSYS
jgi:hypothetical protein